MIKHALRKNLTRELRQSLSRFIAIFAITALGAGFYAGLKSTGPDMALTADAYYESQRLADYRLLSTMGFTEGDLDALRESGLYSAVMPSYGVDALMETPSGPEAARLQALPNSSSPENWLNRPVLVEGRLPEKPDECLVDTAGREAIGDVVRLSPSNTETTLDLLAQHSFTVVGRANSPSYVSFQRGNTNIGNGRIQQFYLVPESAFSSDYYTDLYLRDALAEGQSSFGAAYGPLTEEGQTALEDFAAQREDIRYREILDEGNQTLADARAELADGWAEYEEKRAEAEAELADALRQLEDGQAQANDGQRQIDENAAKLADAQAQLTQGEAELAAGRAALEENRALLADGQTQYDEGLALYEQGYAKYEAGLAEFNTQKAQWQAGKTQYDAGLAAWQQGKAQYDAQAAQLQGLAQAKDGLAGAAGQLAALQPAAESGINPAAEAQFWGIAGGGAGTLRGLASQLSALPGIDPALPASLNGMADGIDAAMAGSDPGRFAAATASLSAAPPVLDAAIAGMQPQLDAALAELNTAKAQLDAAKAQLDAGEAPLAAGQAELDASAALLEASKAKLDESKAQLDAGWQAFAEGEAKLAGGAAELAGAQALMADGQAQLEEARAKLAEARQELADGWAEYEDGRAEADREFADAEETLAEAETEIADGQKELDELDPPEWFVFTREANPGYTGFESDTHRIDSIALIFPVFFFLVATLICLTTMTRMVEENRTQIGTLKALGYSRGGIAFKYLFYGMVASLLGSVAGVLLGSWIFPVAIWDAYSIMYIMPPLQAQLHPVHAPLSVAASVLCTVLATLFACASELRSVPAELMRPKAPRPGKRIFMERITPLWRRMSFIQKVTSRNIFRYKKRFLMTVVGVAGCTALLLTGFGLKDSINGVVPSQFGKIYLYDASVYLADPGSAETPSELNDALPGLGDSLYTGQESVTVQFDGRDSADMTTYLYVAEDPARMPEFISLHQPRTEMKQPLPETGGVLITEKLADRLAAGEGDVIEISFPGEKPVETRVAGVVENYVYNYVYISPTEYEALFGQTPEYNSVLLRYLPGETRTGDQLMEELVAIDGVAGAMDVQDLRNQFADMLDGLNSVVWVVIFSAGSLACVVLYNLTNINITERAREIATLKVLGFYPREVAGYIYRESLFLTLIGTAVGLGLGVLLHQWVITTAEIDEVMFRQIIRPFSFVLAVLFTLLSMGLVDLIMLRKLKKIDMVESLKSAE